jgi:hypothetical protein
MDGNCRSLQLRYAPVGMTLLFEGSIPRFHEGSVELQTPFDFAQGRLSATLPRISCHAALDKGA